MCSSDLISSSLNLSGLAEKSGMGNEFLFANGREGGGVEALRGGAAGGAGISNPPSSQNPQPLATVYCVTPGRSRTGRPGVLRFMGLQRVRHD